jgi:biotin synthase
VGTGVMIGLPYQKVGNMVDDVEFYRKFNIDMVGMGPYLKHMDTPLAKKVINFDEKKQLQLGLKIIALTRIVMKDINIAATTALQALNPVGRELGLKAGANVVMPNITDKKYREYYKLYENKPCIDEESKECRSCLKKRVESIGEKVGFNEWGDSPHYFKRISQKE